MTSRIAIARVSSPGARQSVATIPAIPHISGSHHALEVSKRNASNLALISDICRVRGGKKIGSRSRGGLLGNRLPIEQQTEHWEGRRDWRIGIRDWTRSRAPIPNPARAYF